MPLTQSQKDFINKTTELSALAIQWGFVPLVVYLGFKRGSEPMPNGQIVPLSLMSLLWG